LVCILNLVVILRLYLSTDFLSKGITPNCNNKVVSTTIIPTISTGKLTDHSNKEKNKDNINGTISLCDSSLDVDDIINHTIHDHSTNNSTDIVNGLKHRSKSGIIPNILTQADREKEKKERLSKIIKPIHGIDKIDETLIDHDAVINARINNINDIDDIQNTDILLIIKDRIKITLKNNLLIRVINPFVKIERTSVLRIFAHVFLLLMLGIISNFNTVHIMLLPIMVQNVVDILV
jgi:hypothetical protein